MIHLEKVDWDNYGKVLKLRVAKDQEDFVADNDCSLIHAFLALSEGGLSYILFPPNLIITTTKKKASVHVTDSWQIHIIQLEGLQRF